MKVIGVIPARMASTRFPGKPMAAIHGMPMIGHCFFRTRLTPGLAATYVATCDQEIADYVRGIGGTAVITSTSHTRATTRTAEATEHVEATLGERVDVIVMVQGDEPLILPETIASIIPPFADPNVEIVNVMSRFRTYEDFLDRNNVKVVVNNRSDALYFSREPIPSPWKGWEANPLFMQTGIIAFRRDALRQFSEIPETALEQIESIDLNRVLETGGRVRMVLTDQLTIGVDTLAELRRVEELMCGDPTTARYLSER